MCRCLKRPSKRIVVSVITIVKDSQDRDEKVNGNGTIRAKKLTLKGRFQRRKVIYEKANEHVPCVHSRSI